jgi:hypothetical protein
VLVVRVVSRLSGSSSWSLPLSTWVSRGNRTVSSYRTLSELSDTQEAASVLRTRVVVYVNNDEQWPSLELDCRYSVGLPKMQDVDFGLDAYKRELDEAT